MAELPDPGAEWLEADGLGGFASGTVSGARSRRYHALLLPATTPPAGRMVLVNGFDAWVETAAGRFAISSQAYAPDVTHPDGAMRIIAFRTDPWPTWRFRLEDGTEVEQEIFVPKGRPSVCVGWRLVSRRRARAILTVRPFLSGRDYHALHHENGGFAFEPEERDERLLWRPYPGVPGILSRANGAYHHDPAWFRNFLYTEERARGLDFQEDLASPGVFQFDLGGGPAAWVLSMEDPASLADTRTAAEIQASLRSSERRRRRRFESRLHKAADAYLVQRGGGATVVAGYPWFTDWGRDTFIAIRGLGVAAGRLDVARAVLLEWSGHVSEGMLPNRFPDAGGDPEYNSADAALWYIVAAHDWLSAAAAAGKRVGAADRRRIGEATDAILEGYARGTRHRIGMDGDGLLAAGEPGLQLTWMDAKVGDWVVTPRIGKPVELQALWVNALRLAAARDPRWRTLADRAEKCFATRFWNEAGACLYDVVDAGHEPGVNDPSLRPNQIFSVGGLPHPLLTGERARRVVERVERVLWTPLGLRSLAPGEPGYAPRYEGGVRARDGAYHQGTVWPWLAGAFIEAWLRVRGSTKAARAEARSRFLPGLMAHLDVAGLDHVSEIADADPPHAPRGCPFQAWSVGELLRLSAGVLAEPSPGRRSRRRSLS